MKHATFLTFLIGREYFAVNVNTVLEVLQHPSITHIPKAPDHILGIINFRGEILPVVDTKLKFNINDDGDKSKIIIVFEIDHEGAKTVIAATADSVKDVIEIMESEIKPVPEMGISYNSIYLSGAIRRDEIFILLLNVEKMFSTSDLTEFNQVESLEISSTT